MSWGLRNTALYAGGPTSLVRKEVTPIEWLPLARQRKEPIPFEWRQAGLVRKELIPIEWRQAVIALTRKERTPIEWAGLAVGTLLVQWNVRVRLNTPLPIFWNVLNAPPLASLTVQWNVKDFIPTLTVQWNVLPNVQALFDQDIQRPSASIA